MHHLKRNSKQTTPKGKFNSNTQRERKARGRKREVSSRQLHLQTVAQYGDIIVFYSFI